METNEAVEMLQSKMNAGEGDQRGDMKLPMQIGALNRRNLRFALENLKDDIEAEDLECSVSIIENKSLISSLFWVKLHNATVRVMLATSLSIVDFVDRYNS
jgi:hypothetical protein